MKGLALRNYLKPRTIISHVTRTSPYAGKQAH